MTKQFENKSGSSESLDRFLTPSEKFDLHQFDHVWESIFCDKERKQQLRSLIYRLWGAVLAEKDPSLYSEGIANPYEGNHHIAKLKAKYKDNLKEFISYLIYDLHDGNTSKLAFTLLRWFDPLNKIIKKSPKDIDVKAIKKYIDENKLVLQIRKYLKFNELDVVEESAPEIKGTKKTIQTESKSEEISNTKIIKKIIKSHSIEDIFLDAFVAFIDGDEERANQLREEAIKMDYEDEDVNKQKDDASKVLKKNITQSSVYSCLEFYERRYPSKFSSYVKKMADLEIPAIQYTLANFFFSSGINKNDKEAVKYCSLAAKKGNPEAQFLLAICYIKGMEVDINWQKAVEYFQLAAGQGYVYAQNDLGNCYYSGFGISKNEDEAARWFAKSAEQGYSNAQYNLGCGYLKGRGVEKNEEKAIKLFTLAAEQGDLYAQYNLGYIYHKGEGVEKDPVKAFKWFKLAAKQGLEIAQLNLARCYNNGDGIKKNQKKAFKWYTKAAEQNDPEGQFYLGNCYLKGEGILKDEKKAIKWFVIAAAQNNSLAQYTLGQCYSRGIGVTKDINEAIRWFKLAADKGHVDAQFILASCYDRGVGVKKDKKESLRLVRSIGISISKNKSGNNTDIFDTYKEVALKGDVEIQYDLGKNFLDGIFFEKDTQEAFKWFSLAANNGHTGAMIDLASCFLDGIGIIKDKKEALKWLGLAAEKGDAKAQYHLALMYTEGSNGLTQDDKKAADLYLLSAMQGNAEAQYNLGKYYLSGRGVIKDEEEAVRWLTLSANQGDSDAQVNLGSCYLRGVGVKEVDYTKAFDYYKLAAEQSNPYGQNHLINFYYYGTNVEKDFCQAKKYFDLAKKQGINNVNDEVAVNIAKHAAIEEKIKANHVLINKLKDLENKDSHKIINPKILDLIKKSYEESSNHIKDTGVEFRLEIIKKYNEAQDFLINQKILPSISGSPRPISSSTLQQLQQNMRSN